MQVIETVEESLLETTDNSEEETEDEELDFSENSDGEEYFFSNS